MSFPQPNGRRCRTTWSLGLARVPDSEDPVLPQYPPLATPPWAFAANGRRSCRSLARPSVGSVRSGRKMRILCDTPCRGLWPWGTVTLVPLRSDAEDQEGMHRATSTCRQRKHPAEASRRDDRTRGAAPPRHIWQSEAASPAGRSQRRGRGLPFQRTVSLIAAHGVNKADNGPARVTNAGSPPNAPAVSLWLLRPVWAWRAGDR